MPSLITTADNAITALISTQDLSVYNEHTANTEKTYMFRKTLELNELSCRLSDTAAELKTHCSLLKNRDTTEKTEEYPSQTSEQ